MALINMPHRYTVTENDIDDADDGDHNRCHKVLHKNSNEKGADAVKTGDNHR